MQTKRLSETKVSVLKTKRSIPFSPMASTASKSSLLPVSDPPKDDDDKLFKGSTMTRRGAFASISYMSCADIYLSVDELKHNDDFPCANVITLCQMISSNVLLFVLRRSKLISFSGGEAFDNGVGFVPLKTLIRTSPIAFSYLLYMLATMESIRGVNVPMYTTLRRTTVIFTMVVEYTLSGQRYSSSIFGSVALIIFGAFIAGARDLSFDSYGYSVVFLSNITTAVYLATISRIGKSSGLNTFGLMWCNGIICGPILLFWTYVRGDLEITMNFQDLFSPGFLVVLFLSCLLAFFLNYSIFLNTTLNSALTQTICGNLKDFFTIGLGWMLFGGLPFDFFNVVGQVLGFVGSGLYAYCKLVGK